ncbi:MAG TPA: transketolase [Chthoniobacterales bacterium]|nr:transketolase [Chthoniobacterales bacterium]
MNEPTLAAASVCENGHEPELREMANAIRALAMDAVEQANSGHPGMPLGMADVATVLFTRFLKFDPLAPWWPDRDRFILSAGHGSMLQYAIHHLVGYIDMNQEQIRRFRQLGSVTAGHPEYGRALGIEATTGPLGQGLATSVGMALAERILNARFGDELVDHYTYVIAGDGCLMEGISQEAIDLAGHLRLQRLIVLWDDNGISIDGATGLSTSTDQLTRFRSSGWNVEHVNGHDPQQVATAIRRAKKADRPSLIACRTVIGFGAPNKQGSETVHGAPLGKAEVAAARIRLGWSAPPFKVPDTIKKAWRQVGQRGQIERVAWQSRLANSQNKGSFLETWSNHLPVQVFQELHKYKRQLFYDKPTVASRKASQLALTVINTSTDRLIGGSADLTHSNLTITKGLSPIRPGEYAGRYVHYGVREHAMGAAMNGLALHGGFVPYGGTFLAFADYARAAIRLSALMHQRVIYVLTHDSIGLGEDGPTHQPIEHLAMLRATPNLHVLRPADAIETVECWDIALRSRETPSALCLSRQNLPTLRTTHSDDNLCARGAYVLHETEGERGLTLLATGSEVEIALKAAKLLSTNHSVQAAVVSMPCWDLFESQPACYREAVLGQAPRVAVEAASRLGWDRWVGESGIFVGMTGFGESAPAQSLYERFRITADAVSKAALSLIGAARANN